jgi:hypothetical protein
MKQFLLVLSLIIISAPVMASLAIKPGKWRIETQMSTEGKAQIDPMAKMREAMKDMTPAQRKQMQDMMAKMGKTNPDMPKVGFDPNGMTICYTKEMLDGDLGLKKQQEDQKCKVSDMQKSSTKISMKFKCEDGASGDSQWNITDSTHMNGVTKIVTSKGKKSEIKFKAEFLTAKCD